MKKSELYKIVKQGLKEVLTEKVTPGTGDQSIELDPWLQPADGWTPPPPPPQTLGCAADPQFNLSYSYEDYGDFTAQLIETGPFGMGVCQTVTIPQDYICCSATNSDEAEINPFSIQTAYDVNGSTGNINTNFNFVQSWGCYCPNPTTVPHPTSIGDTLIVSCDITGGQNNWDDFNAWNIMMNPAGAAWFSGGGGSTAGLLWPDMAMNCPGCTYDGAENYDVLYDVEDGSCIIGGPIAGYACNAEGFDNYFCTDQSSYAGLSIIDPGQNLCASNLPSIIPTPAIGAVGVAEVNDDDICVFEGCYDINQPMGPTGYGLPNTNFVCTTNAFASILCNPGLTGEATMYAANDGSIQIPTINNAGCQGTPVVIGCTNSLFNPSLPGGNYNANANINMGIGGYNTQECNFTGCLIETDTSTGYPNVNFVCTLEPLLCNGNIPDNGMGSFTPDNNTCYSDVVLGCMDTAYAEYSQYHSWDSNDANGPFPNQGSSDGYYCNTSIIDGCTESANAGGNFANNYFCDGLTATGIYACTGVAPGALPIATLMLPNPFDLPNLISTAIQLVIDDGSCDYDLDDDSVDDDDEVFGCGDPTATNYDPLVTDPGLSGAFTAQNYLDGGCTYEFFGCTDANANNWLDPANTTIFPNPPYITTGLTQNTTITDDGSCGFPSGCTDPNATNWVGAGPAAYTIEDGSCIFEGCTQPLSSNQTLVSSTITLPNGVNPYDGKKIISSVSVGTTVGATITGTDDGSCNFNQYCTVSTMTNYVCNTYPALCTGTIPPPFGVPNSSLGAWTSSGCQASEKPGCTDDTAGITGNGPNDQYTDNEDVNGNGSYLATNYDPVATLGNSADICNYNFCSDTDAYNYSSTDPRGELWGNNITNIPQLSLCEYEGCSDPSADPGNEQTEYPGWAYFTSTPLYYYNSLNGGCQSTSGGTKDSMTPTGDLGAQNDDCCPYGGCLDDGTNDQQWWDALQYPSQPGYPSIYPNDLVGQPPANTNAYPSNGMTSPVIPNNTSTTATVDDGSCQYNFGCTIPDAPNYVPSATVENNTCLEPCKTIRAKQCNPDPNVPSGHPDHIIKEICAHHGTNSTPIIGDMFHSPKGILYPPQDPNQPWISPSTKAYCPQSHAAALQSQNYMAQYSNCGGQGATNCATCDDVYGFTYMWSSGAAAWYWEGTCVQCTTLNPTTFTYEDPITSVTGLCVECTEKYPEPIRDVTWGTGVLSMSTEPQEAITAVFEIFEVTAESQKPIKFLPPWNCNTAPPVPTPHIGIGRDHTGPAEPISQGTIGEVETSKKLRKSLKSYFLLSEEDKLKELIKKVIK